MAMENNVSGQEANNAQAAQGVQNTQGMDSVQNMPGMDGSQGMGHAQGMHDGMVNGAHQAMNGVPHMMNGGSQMMDGGQQMMSGGPQMMHGGPQMMDGGNMMMQHGGNMMNGGFGPMGFVGPIVGGVIHIIFFAFVLYIIWTLVKMLRTYLNSKLPVEGNGASKVNGANRLTDNEISEAISKGQNPLTYLQYRLVNGELSPEEYREIRQELLNGTTTEIKDIQ